MYMCVLLFALSDFSSIFLQYFDTVGWVLTCKNRLPYNLYCVDGDVKHCSTNHTST